MPDMSVTLPVGVIVTLAVGYIHLMISNERTKLLLAFGKRCDDLEKAFADKIHLNTQNIELHSKDIQNINANILGLSGRVTTIDSALLLLRDADVTNRHGLRNEFQEYVGKMYLQLNEAQKEIREKLDDLRDQVNAR